MKFNSILLIISFLLIISNIISKKFKKNHKKSLKKPKRVLQSVADTDEDLMLLEKYMELQPNSEKDNLDDEEESNNHGQDYKEDVIYNTRIETKPDEEEDDEDDKNREEEKKADTSLLIDQSLLETNSKLKSETKIETEVEAESLENYQNYVEKKLDMIALNQNDMIDESKLVQKKTVTMINELKKNLSIE